MLPAALPHEPTVSAFGSARCWSQQWRATGAVQLHRSNVALEEQRHGLSTSFAPSIDDVHYVTAFDAETKLTQLPTKVVV